MSAGTDRPDNELTLGEAFSMVEKAAESAETTPESDPDQDADGLYALGQRLLPGDTTVVEQEASPNDRVANGSGCPRCGRPWDGEGVCPEHEAEGDLVDSPLRTAGGTR